jgi:hypothetical protein
MPRETNLLKLAADPSRLRIETMVQGPNRSPWDEKAAHGDGVTLTMYSVGSKPVALSHVCVKRVEDALRMPFEIHQHLRNEWRLEPGALRTTWTVGRERAGPVLALARSGRQPRARLEGAAQAAEADQAGTPVVAPTECGVLRARRRSAPRAAE